MSNNKSQSQQKRENIQHGNNPGTNKPNQQPEENTQAQQAEQNRATQPTETQKTSQPMPDSMKPKHDATTGVPSVDMGDNPNSDFKPEENKPDQSQPGQATGSIAGTPNEEGDQLKISFFIETRAEYNFSLMPTGNDDRYFMADSALWDDYTRVKSEYDSAVGKLRALADGRQVASGGE